jgi:hypothetical protein
MQKSIHLLLKATLNSMNEQMQDRMRRVESGGGGGVLQCSSVGIGRRWFLNHHDLGQKKITVHFS